MAAPAAPKRHEEQLGGECSFPGGNVDETGRYECLPGCKNKERVARGLPPIKKDCLRLIQVGRRK